MDANKDTEVEITPEMIEAGFQVFLAWEDSDEPSAKTLVSAIYRAMILRSRCRA